MSDRKTMTNEQLPMPEETPGGADPRARVLRKYRQLRNVASQAAAGALTAACTGYGVVDPLPPPSECSTAFTNGRMDVQARASYVATGSTVGVELLLQRNSYGGPNNLVFDTVTATAGATIDTITDIPTGKMVVLSPIQGATEILVDYEWSCTDSSGSFDGQRGVTIVLPPGPGQPGTSLRVSER